MVDVHFYCFIIFHYCFYLVSNPELLLSKVPNRCHTLIVDCHIRYWFFKSSFYRSNSEIFLSKVLFNRKNKNLNISNLFSKLVAFFEFWVFSTCELLLIESINLVYLNFSDYIEFLYAIDH